MIDLRFRRLSRLQFVLACLLLAPAAAVKAQIPAPTAAPRPLSLEGALGLAERESEAVGIARADLGRARGERRRARSGYLPQLNGSASYQRTLRSQFSALQSEGGEGEPVTPPEECARFVPRPGLPVEERLDSLEAVVECTSNADPFAGLGDLPFGRENTYRFGLSFSQSLFTGGRLSGQTQAAGAGVRSAELGLTSARAQLLLDVTSAYYDATLADRLVSIARATLQQADTTLSQTQLARQVGNQSEFDLLRARVTRDNQRPILIQREADRDLAYYRLKQLINLPLQQPLALTTTLGDSAMVDSTSLAELVEVPGDTATAARLPVLQAAEGVESQQGLLRVARSQRLPQLSLLSDYAELGYPSDGSPFGTDYLSDWTVSVALQLPLFTGGRIRGDVEVARANLDQARLRHQQTRELAQVDARSAELQLQSAIAGWEASAGTEEQATRAYQIAEVRYREGISTQTELNDLRIQLAQAQATRARAARDLQVARTRLALLPALPLEGSMAPAAAATAAGGGGTGQTPQYQPPPPPTGSATTFTSGNPTGTVTQ
ncbi:MAG: TolC family protein [Gemmatimonadales bacterium]|nr:TolC family protein [Gemmatimonadales bacterium]MBA3554764.1 TolC family protein [Gemmatimonadales bacterium]